MPADETIAATASGWPERTIWLASDSDRHRLSDAEAELFLSASEADPVFLNILYDDLPGPSLVTRYRISRAWQERAAEAND